MRLPRCGTGFGDLDSPPTAGLRPAAYRSICHSVAARLGGAVRGFEPASVTPSFHRAEIDLPGRRRLVACHATVPAFAVAAGDGAGAPPVRFVADPELSAALGLLSRLPVWSPEQLATPVEQCDLSELHPAERAQLASWQPRTAGEALFNWWD